jgi:hypothetical protein
MSPISLLRERLVTALSGERLDEFCFEYFPVVFSGFDPNMSKERKTQTLLEYCVRHLKVSELLRNLNDYQHSRAKEDLTNDILPDVIDAIGARRNIAPELSEYQISLVSLKNFDRSNIPSIRDIQDYVLQRYNVRLIVSGGGYGCSKIKFKVESDSAENASKFIKDLLQDEAFREKALEAEFTVLIIERPFYERVDLRNMAVDGLSDQKQPIKTKRMNLKINREAVRMLIMNAFDDNELTILCFDYFPEVYDNILHDISKSMLTIKLIEHCIRHDKAGVLLNKIKERNPNQYALYENRLFSAA